MIIFNLKQIKAQYLAQKDYFEQKTHKNLKIPYSLIKSEKKIKKF